ncbi:tape measure protein [Klebsiella pneumoniae]
MAGTFDAGSVIYEVDMDTSRLLAARREVDAALNGLNGSMGRLEASVNRTERSISSMEGTMSSLTGVAKGLLAALSVQQVGAYAQAWQDMSNKLSNAVRDSVPPFETLADVTNRVFDIAQKTRSGLDATATLYARLERSTRSYGVSVEDLTRLTTIINQGFVVSGASAEEASNAIIQLAQGMASGALRGDEFNSVNEQGNRLMIALADSLGVGIGELRNMAAQGKLTTDVIVNGLLSQGDSIGKEFAKTTSTISQSLEIAGNNVARFFGENATVKTGVKIFSDSVILASENIQVLGTALTVVAGIMGSRYVGALAMATAAKVQDTAASIAQSKASAVAAKDAEIEAAAKLRLAGVEKDAAIRALSLAEGRLATIRATNASVASEVQLAEAQTAQIRTQIAQIESEKALEAQRLKAQITDQGRIATATRMAQLQQASTVLNQRLASAEAATAQARASAIAQAEAQVSASRLAAADATAAATAANGRYIASQEASAVASRAASVAGGVLKGALGLIGGPAGAAMLAAAAVFYFWQKAQQAREESLRFADGLDRVNASMKAMNNTQLRGTIADANKSIRAQKDEISDLQSEVDSLRSRYQNFTPEAQAVAESMGQGADFARQQAEVSDQLNQKTRDLANAQDKLARTQDTAAEANRTLTNNMLTSMGVHDGLIQKGWSLEQVQGAVAKAFGLTADEINRANQAGQNFNPKALQVSPPTADGDKVILNLEEQNELLKIQDERQRAVTKARMQAAKVTDNPNQISRAGDLAGENYDLQKAEEARQEAQRKGEQQDKRSASAAESVSQKLEQLRQKAMLAADSSQELSREQSILSAQQSLGKGATQEQIALAGKYAAQAYDVAAAIKAQQKAEKDKQDTESAYAQVRQAASPVVAVDDQFQKQMASLNAYATLYPQKIAEVEATRAQIEEQYRQKRQEAMWQELSQQSLGYNMLTSAVDAFSGNASNAITGLLTGTMSAQEAMQSLGNTILNSVINSIVQVGVEMLKNFILSQTLGAAAQAANAASAIAGGAAALAAWTPAAIAASIATGGTASATGLTAYKGAQAAGLATSVLGARYNGGPVSAGGLYQVGEKGKPEIYQASTGKQYMIPGDNGKVISNKDMNGGQVQVNIQFYDQTSGGQHSFQAQASQEGGVVTVEAFLIDVDRNGPMSSAIQSAFGLGRKAQGAY